MSDIESPSPDLCPYLTLAGTLPFLIGASCLLMGVGSLPGGIDTAQMMSGYGLVILSFMAGVHWGQHLHLSGKWMMRLPLASNLIALSGWAGFLILNFQGFCLLLAAGFLALLWIDRLLLQERHISEEYFRIRLTATLIVVSSLILTAA